MKTATYLKGEMVAYNKTKKELEVITSNLIYDFNESQQKETLKKLSCNDLMHILQNLHIYNGKGIYKKLYNKVYENLAYKINS